MTKGISVFDQSNGKSPVNQDFIWLGEYLDGTHLAEFNLQTGKENYFHDLQKSKLLRFGLIGHGMKLIAYRDGVFSIAGVCIEVGYRIDGKYYPLTGYTRQNYTDVITFKDAESMFVQGGGVTRPHINMFSFGYKANITTNGINFHFKPIVKVPYNKPIYMNFWLVADQDLDGEFVVKRNNKEVYSVHAPLRKGIGGETDWVVK
jgi:hypothetical protein